MKAFASFTEFGTCFECSKPTQVAIVFSEPEEDGDRGYRRTTLICHACLGKAHEQAERYQRAFLAAAKELAVAEDAHEQG